MEAPANRARRQMELSNLIEGSQEHRESERWAIGLGDDIPEPPESVYGMRFLQTPPSTFRSHRGPYKNVQHSVSFEGDHKHGVVSARSMPDLNSTSQRCNGSVAGPAPAIQYIQSSNGQKHPTDSRSMGMSGRKDELTFSNSLSNQPPDLVVAKRRQRTDSGMFLMDSESVHLEDMGISHRLASQPASSAPVSCNPSLAELIHNNRYGVFMNSSQENMPVAQRSTTSVASGYNAPAPAYHHQVGSSYYSHQPSSISANASPRSNSFTVDAGNHVNHVGGVHGSKYDVGAEEIRLHHDSARTSPAIGSKFQEHCDNEKPPGSQTHIESKDVQRIGAPRKVSVGWMSGGRRVGYGYSPVPDDEAARYNQHEHGHPNVQQTPDHKAEVQMRDINVQGGHARQKQVQRTDLVRPAPLTIPETRSTSVNDHANHPEVDADTLFKLQNSSQTRNEYPQPSYLREILAGRYSQEQDCRPMVSEKRSTMSLQAPETPTMTQFEHCHVQQDSNYTGQQSDPAVHRSPRLSQSMNSHPQNQKNKRVRRTALPGSVRQEKERHVSAPGHHEVDIDPDYLGIEYDFDAEDVARLLRPSNARGANWVRRLSKRNSSKRDSNAHQIEASQTSPGLYHARFSNSLERANPTKSIGTNAEELASMYQECLDMPGSFEGSRWASRTSRMLWDLVTTDDR